MPKIEITVCVEEKRFQNRYQIDTGRPHITVRAHDKPNQALLALTRICPAKCCEENERGQVAITADGCRKCGTCRVLCESTGEIEWNDPRGGFGVLFKFG